MSHRIGICRWISVLSHALLHVMLFAALLASGEASAIVVMTPGVCEVTSHAGTRKQFLVTLKSSADTPLKCQAYITAFAMDEDGITHQAVQQGNDHDASSWITCEPQDFQLGPGKSQAIKCTLKIPQGSSGSYYAVISAIAKPTNRSGKSASGATVSLSFKGSCVVLVAVTNGNPRPDFAVRSIDLSRTGGQSTGPGNGWQVRVRMANEGGLYCWTMGSAEVRNATGARIWQGELSAGGGLLAPGFTRLYKTTAPITLTEGDYTVSMMVYAKGTKQVIRASQAFRVADGKALAVDAKGPEWARTSPVALSQQEVQFTNIPAGAQRQHTLQIRNLCDKQGSYLVEVCGWRVTQDNAGELCPPEEDPQGASTWVEVMPKQVVLGPNAVATLRLIARPPIDASGEHYCALLLKPQVDNALAMPVLITVTPKDTERVSVDVSGLTVTAASGEGHLLKFLVRNTGNVRIAPSMALTIVDAHGNQVGEIIKPTQEQETIVLPGAAESYQFLYDRLLPPGKYVLKVTVKPFPSTEAATVSQEFSVTLSGSNSVPDARVAGA